MYTLKAPLALEILLLLGLEALPVERAVGAQFVEVHFVEVRLQQELALGVSLELAQYALNA